MQGEITLYDTLEVSPRACPQVIRAAYRALAQSNHPDKQPGSESSSERQAAINYAYSVLSDPLKRQRYDLSIALVQRFVERRGATVPTHADTGDNTRARQGLRRFAFRPLM